MADAATLKLVPNFNSAKDAALYYIHLGIAPVSVPLRKKKPLLNGWQRLRITAEEVPEHFSKPSNIGGLMGPLSNGLTDVDLDCKEAVDLAPFFLPPCGAVFGRPGNPKSHYLYLSDLCGHGHGAKIATFDDNGKMVCELRIGDDDKGAQTILPPSIHMETDELIEWCAPPKLEFIASIQLIAAFRNLSVASLLARVWPREESNRDQIAMAIGGAMATREVPEDDAVEIVGQVAEYAGDNEVGMRKDVIRDSYRKHEKGEPVTGLPTLKELLDNDKMVKRISDALGKRKSEFPDNTKDGYPRPTLPNAKKAIELLEIEVCRDLFKQDFLVNGHKLESYAVGTLNDAALYRIRELIYDNFGFDPPTPTVRDAVYTLANHHQFHPVCDYLDSLVWDGVPRINTWLIDYAGAEDTPYTQAVSCLPLLAAVRRVRRPGCKFDEMLVLEGKQGTDRSQALEVLAVRPEWFSDSRVFGLSGRDAIEALTGKWIIEASELDGIHINNLPSVKAFLSRVSDRGRGAYAHTTGELKRQCVFIGTTNDDKYLLDPTGNRRWWPVLTRKPFDLEALKRDRDQLWAEAAAREAKGESIRLPKELWAAAAEQQQQRMVDNPLLARLDLALRGPDQPIFDDQGNRTGEEVGKPLTGFIVGNDLWTLLEIKPSQITQRHNDNMGAAMKLLGWEHKQRRVDGEKPWGYQRGDDKRRIYVQPGVYGAAPTAGYTKTGLPGQD